MAGASFALQADLGAATRQDFEPSASGGLGKTAWWSWEAAADGIFLWNADPSGSPVAVRVFVDREFGLELIGESYRRPRDGAWEFDSSGSLQVRQGQKYLIQLEAAVPPSAGPILGVPGPAQPTVNLPVLVRFAYPEAPAPDNDRFSRAIALVGTNATFHADLLAATADEGEPAISDAVLHRTVWWTWQAPGYGSVEIRFLGTNAPSIGCPLVGVYGRGAFQSLNMIASSATEFGNTCQSEPVARRSVRWHVSPGTIYFIQVDRFPSLPDVAGDFELVFNPAPPNDTVEAATVLLGTDFSFVASNLGATQRSGEMGSGTSTVWFRWTAPTNGIVQLTTAPPLRYDEPHSEPTDQTGSGTQYNGPPCLAPFVDLHPLPDFAPVLSLLEGSPLPTMTLANILGTNGIIWEAAKDDFWMVMDGVSGSEGATNLNFLFTPPPVNDAFSGRVSLASESVRVFGRTFGATQAASPAPDPVFPEQDRALFRSAWWEWKAPAAGLWTLFLKSGVFDNRVVIYPAGQPTEQNYLATTTWEPLVFQAGTNDVFEIGAFARTQYGSSVEFTLTPVTAPALRFGRLSFPGGGGLQFAEVTTADNSGLPFAIERSSDLAHWIPVGRFTNAWSATFLVPTDSDASANFFRTRLSSGQSGN